jgi:hypothetical protein
MRKEHKMVLGKVDYNKSGRKNCKAVLEWSLSPEGEFSMSASIWNPRETDIYCGGQCVDEVVAYFPRNATAQRMAEIWRRWHLNHMKAGSPAQAAHLRTLGEWTYGRDGFNSHYDWACEKLKEVGLLEDASYLHNGKPYRYGSAWLKEELPADVRAEIESWG